MDAQQRGHTVNDEGLDREIQQALAVEPSPEFSARVRAAVAAAPAPAPWSMPWMVVAPAGVAALIALALILSPGHEGPAPFDARSSATAADVILAPRRASSSDAPAPVREAGVPRVSPARAAARRPRPAPEVLVPPMEREGLRRLMAFVRNTTIDGASFGFPVRSVTEAIEPVPRIEISPVIVEPLDRSGQ